MYKEINTSGVGGGRSAPNNLSYLGEQAGGQSIGYRARTPSADNSTLTGDAAGVWARRQWREREAGKQSGGPAAVAVY